jgi:hypothetical protein
VTSTTRVLALMPLLFLAGCSLLVDFDRSRITTSDAGDAGDDASQDASQDAE